MPIIQKTKVLCLIRYKNKEDKDTINNSLKLLKTAPTPFKHLRISDDLTIEKQIELRKLIKEAKEMNEAETDKELKHVVHYNRFSKNHFIASIKIRDKTI